MVSGEDAGGEVVVRVADEGEGIDPDHLPNIFLKFYRRGSGERRTGTGLGLYICRGIVQAHDGELIVERSDPTGTVFAVPAPEGPRMTSDIRGRVEAARDEALARDRGRRHARRAARGRGRDDRPKGAALGAEVRAWARFPTRRSRSPARRSSRRSKRWKRRSPAAGRSSRHRRRRPRSQEIASTSRCRGAPSRPAIRIRSR